MWIVLVRLHGYDLLPETKRVAVAAAIRGIGGRNT